MHDVDNSNDGRDTMGYTDADLAELLMLDDLSTSKTEETKEFSFVMYASRLRRYCSILYKHHPIKFCYRPSWADKSNPLSWVDVAIPDFKLGIELDACLLNENKSKEFMDCAYKKLKNYSDNGWEVIRIKNFGILDSIDTFDKYLRRVDDMIDDIGPYNNL
jgi:hypothetical protein